MPLSFSSDRDQPADAVDSGILSPAHGKPLATPNQDRAWCHYLTQSRGETLNPTRPTPVCRPRIRDVCGLSTANEVRGL
jgi:hypothetical protein